MQVGQAVSNRYGVEHWKLRGRYQKRMSNGEAIACWRCGKPVDPKHWHLGHKDGSQRDEYAGPEHPTCNTQTSTHRAAAKQRPPEQHPGLIGG